MMLYNGELEYIGWTRSNIAFSKLATLVLLISSYYVNLAEAIHNDRFEGQFQTQHSESLDNCEYEDTTSTYKTLSSGNTTSTHKTPSSRNTTSTHKTPSSRNTTSTHKPSMRPRAHVTKLYVDKFGHGNTTSIQKAIDMVKVNNTQRVIIYIAEGTYYEKVIVPKNKQYITFQGAGMDKSIITYGNSKINVSSTTNTASITVKANHFVAHNISFQNSAHMPQYEVEGVQLNGTAVALKVSGDLSAFFGCGMYGYQDTLHDDKGRHLFKDCHIEGMVDFIFGNGRSLYQNCTIQSLATKNGSITAQFRTSHGEHTGFVFVYCTIQGSGINMLGRAWHPYARVVIALSNIQNMIDPAGWDSLGENKTTLFFGEYGNSGPGASMTGRVSYTKALSAIEAHKFTSSRWINGSKHGWFYGI